MVKEKIIFWPLLVIFIGIVAFVFFSQDKKKDETEKVLLQDIESAAKKAAAKKKAASKDNWDFEIVKKEENQDAYKLLLQRSPFFRIQSEVKVENKEEPISVTIEPKKQVLKYKGKMMVGQKVMVIIEDIGTGKSFFAQEGEMVGEYMVASIDDKGVVLKKKGGEEVVLSAVKKEETKEEKKVDEKEVKETEEKGKGKGQK